MKVNLQARRTRAAERSRSVLSREAPLVPRMSFTALPERQQISRSPEVDGTAVARAGGDGHEDEAPAATDAGRRLLAHELTHTVQQGAAPAATIQRQAHGPLPGHSQTTNTCGPSSILTALLVMDTESAAAGQPGQALVQVIDRTIAMYQADQANLTVKFDKYFKDEAPGSDIYRRSVGPLAAVKAQVQAGQAVAQHDYNNLANSIYLLFYDHNAGSTPIMDAGLNTTEIERMHQDLGLTAGTQGAPAGGKSVAGGLMEMFDDPAVTGLGPGRMAQVVTEVSSRGISAPHAFLIGRFADGRWFLSDQAYRPPRDLVEDNDFELLSRILNEMEAGYWLQASVSYAVYPLDLQTPAAAQSAPGAPEP